MPTQTTENDEIRVKIVYNGEVQITYIEAGAGMSVDALREEMRGICGFTSTGPGLASDQFTMKWVDEEGDPCTIGSQPELDEALRLYELNKDTEITIHGPALCECYRCDSVRESIRPRAKGCLAPRKKTRI